MGRAGGGGGGGHFSGGGHSFSSSRSGSSHSFSRSSGRSGGRSGGASFGGSSWGGHGHGGPWYGGPRYSRPFISGVGYRGTYVSGGGIINWISTIVLVVVLIAFVFGIITSIVASLGGNIPANTTNRQKLELGYGYSNNTLTDEIGWIKSPGRLNRDLKDFYDATGITPYIALVYRPEVPSGDASEFAYADQWYQENLEHEGYMLLMYFSTGQEDNGVDGTCQLVLGRQAAALMDEEAQNIFWACLDRYWFSDVDEDTLFASTFQDTAKRIMQKTTTGKDVLVKFFGVAIVVCAVAGIVIVMKLKRKHEAERAKETAQILSQPLSGSASDADEDELLNQYSDDDT